MQSKLKKFLIGTSLIFLPLITFAQFNMGGGVVGNELGVEIIPQYPRPNEAVTINLSLYTDNLDSATIEWRENGKIVLSGKGEKKYSFKMGSVGLEKTIGINVVLQNGGTITKNIVLNPASVDLVWEAVSYVPPFYKGKALHPRQGLLKVVAMPEFVKGGQRISSTKLIYNWSNDVESYQSQSGYGKNTLLLNGSLLGRQESLEVLVTDPANGLAAQGFITIEPSDQKVVFYENDPYYGYLFENATQNSFELKKDEVQLVAAPYYFSKESSGLIKYDWSLNGNSVPELYNSRTAIFRKPEGESGHSTISLNVENLNRVLQQADNNLEMNFKK